MTLLKNFKLNFNIKLFNDYIKNENYDSASDLLNKFRDKKPEDLYDLLSNCQQSLNTLPDNFYKKKLLWTVSYDLNDISYINNFLNFYFEKNSKFNFNFQNYANTLSKIFSNDLPNKFKNNIEFNEIINNSNLFQNYILFSSNYEYLLLNSCSAFFETNQKSYFTNPNITFCYIYIAPDPARLFYKYKQNYNSSEAAFDEIFNLGNRFYQNSNQSNNNLKVLENRTNLNTHVKSWTNSNVINTYKGKVISYEKLVHETEEVLIEIIYHLKQYGMNLEVNLDDIKYFISNNIIENDLSPELSKKERKFLDKNLDTTILNF